MQKSRILFVGAFLASMAGCTNRIDPPLGARAGGFGNPKLSETDAMGHTLVAYSRTFGSAWASIPDEALHKKIFGKSGFGWFQGIYKCQVSNDGTLFSCRIIYAYPNVGRLKNAANLAIAGYKLSLDRTAMLTEKIKILEIEIFMSDGESSRYEKVFHCNLGVCGSPTPPPPKPPF